MKRIVSILLSVSVLLVLTVLSAVTVKAAETNVALKKPVEASGYYEAADSDESPSMVNDGDLNTKWCARPEDLPEDQTVEDDGHWIKIDLEKPTIVSKFAIRQASECERDAGQFQYNIVSYKIEVSVDGEKWFTLIEEEDLFDEAEDGEQFENYTKVFDPISIRYFKLTTTKPALDGETQTVRLPEIEVYSAPEGAAATDIQAAADKLKAASTPAPTATPTATPTTAAPTTAAPTTAAATTAAAAATTASTSGSSDGLSIEAIIGIIGGVVVVGGIAAFFVIKKKKG